MAKSRVLVVDDDSLITQMVSQYLQSGGFEVLCAHDGLEALAHLEQQHCPIVLLDVRMPGMTGLDLLRTLKKDNPMCIVIMMTGFHDQGMVVECLGHGAQDYLVKPFSSLKVVLEAVQQASDKVHRWTEALMSSSYMRPRRSLPARAVGEPIPPKHD